MSIESSRLDLYDGLKEVLGPDRATTLMAHLPATESPDLLTVEEFRAEMTGFRSDMRSEMGGFRSDMRSEMGEFRAEIRAALADVNKRIDRVLLTLVAGLFVLVAAMFTSGYLF